MKIFKVLAFMVAAMVAVPAFGGSIFFEIGDVRTNGAGNNWPGPDGDNPGELPEFAIDGVGQKYLNFAIDNTGIAVTPASGPSTAVSITVWAANDSPERDPVSYEVYGLNGSVSGDPGDLIGGLTLISEGPISFGGPDPEGRNAGGDEPLQTANSGTTFFANATAYDSYVVLFPSVDGSTCCMQAAEIQLNVSGGAPIFAPGDAIRGGQGIVPEPSTCLLALFGSVLMGFRVRS